MHVPISLSPSLAASSLSWYTQQQFLSCNSNSFHTTAIPFTPRAYLLPGPSSTNILLQQPAVDPHRFWGRGSLLTTHESFFGSPFSLLMCPRCEVVLRSSCWYIDWCCYSRVCRSKWLKLCFRRRFYWVLDYSRATVAPNIWGQITPSYDPRKRLVHDRIDVYDDLTYTQKIVNASAGLYNLLAYLTAVPPWDGEVIMDIGQQVRHRDEVTAMKQQEVFKFYRQNWFCLGIV